MNKKTLNKIVHFTYAEYDAFKKSCPFDKNTHVVELDGRTIQSCADYLQQIRKTFAFPYPEWNLSLDGYQDWIRDLSWLEKDGYVLIIKNYSEFIKYDLESKNSIISSLKNTVLPWWQTEVEHCVVEGKPKPFMVYLVD